MVFSNNTGSIFGKDINSPPSDLLIDFQNTQILSGSTLNPFQITLLNSNRDIYTLTLPQDFLITTQIEGLNTKVSGKTQKELINGQLIMSNEGEKISVFGPPGTYQIYVGPRKTDSVYPSIKFGKYFNVTILPCPTDGYAVGVDFSCRKIECTECTNGKCVAFGNCSCFDGWEGLRCDLIKGTSHFFIFNFLFFYFYNF